MLKACSICIKVNQFGIFKDMRAGGGSDQRVTFGFGFGLANGLACIKKAKKVARSKSTPQRLKETGKPEVALTKGSMTKGPPSASV
jgi:hypothetical protein